jgi:hypothetical protein
MARNLGSVTQYADRTVDLLVFQNPGVGNLEMVDMILIAPDERGKICTGIVKLAQRFLLELLTEAGSVLYDQSRGTAFMTDLRLGRVRTVIDAEISFALAADDAKLQLQLEETDEMPEDEQFGRVELLTLSIGPADTLKVNLALYSAAGVGVTLILPLETTIG